jgi:hypothetical protein
MILAGWGYNPDSQREVCWNNNKDANVPPSDICR